MLDSERQGVERRIPDLEQQTRNQAERCITVS